MDKREKEARYNIYQLTKYDEPRLLLHGSGLVLARSAKTCNLCQAFYTALANAIFDGEHLCKWSKSNTDAKECKP